MQGLRGVRGLRVERLDHLGIVAGDCQEIGLAAYLDEQVGPGQQQVSISTAAVAMILKRTLDWLHDQRTGVLVATHDAIMVAATDRVLAMQDGLLNQAQ
jgi:hypothetical protein